MGRGVSSFKSAIVLAGAVSQLLAVLLSVPVVCEEKDVGSDFALEVGGFHLVNLQQERVCRPLTGVPRGVVEPWAPSTPPPAPYEGFTFDTAVVYQRHGTRRSMMGDFFSTTFYGNTYPGQLLPQGAYELHVAGIEMRLYLLDALGLLVDKVRVPESSSGSADEVYARTLGIDFTEDCRMVGVDPSRCTLSELVSAVGRAIPASSLYVRSSALPRTQWSGLVFLEGFYGLPFGCTGTVAEMEDTRGGRTGTVCVRRSACDTSLEKLELADSIQEKCLSASLPCVHTVPPTVDGLMCGATVSEQAYAEANAHYQLQGVTRSYEPKDPQVREALDIAMMIWGPKVLGRAWMAGEMAFSELGAGETKPLVQLADWVEEQKRLCKDPAAACNPEQVRTYESLLKDLQTAYREGINMTYADGKFSRYVISPGVALQNALFRVKAFGRDEDREHMQNMLYLIEGFEGLKQDEAVHKLQLLLISFHDFVISGLMEMLGISDGEVLPFAVRLTFELSHAKTATGLRGTKTHGNSNDFEPDMEGLETDSGRCTWPENTHFVRVLLGAPGKKQEPVPLPWCDNAIACPLSRWLNYTYGQVKGHMFYEVATFFKQKFAEAHALQAVDSAVEVS